MAATGVHTGKEEWKTKAGPCLRLGTAGTARFGTRSAEQQQGPLVDGATGYLAQKYTNQDVDHFLANAGNASIVHTFGHGGGPDLWRNAFYISFWKNNQWSILSETSAVQSLIPPTVPWQYMRSLEIQPKFAKLILAVLVGCFTAQEGRKPKPGDPSPQNWGSPAAGAICLGAKCTVGFSTTIHARPGRVERSPAA